MWSLAAFMVVNGAELNLTHLTPFQNMSFRFIAFLSLLVVVDVPKLILLKMKNAMDMTINTRCFFLLLSP